MFKKIRWVIYMKMISCKKLFVIGYGENGQFIYSPGKY